jgi:hypothetical protein
MYNDVEDPRTNIILGITMSHNPLSYLCHYYINNILLLKILLVITNDLIYLIIKKNLLLIINIFY